MQDHLSDKRLATLILRLTLDGHGRFMHGEVVDLNGVHIGGFMEWLDLTSLVQVWLATHEVDGGPDTAQ